jgi:DNA-binding NarL/FixJ family response regulator
MIQEALRLCANGYIVKSDAIELLAAIEAIQENRIFLSKSLAASWLHLSDSDPEDSDHLSVQR